MVNRWSLVAVTVIGFAASGCVHTAFTPTTRLALAARPPDCYLDLILQGRPPFPYVVLGQITTDSTAPGLFALGESNDVAIKRMTKQACAVGAHGLLNVGANSQGVWTGNGYSKSTTGGAVAFIYVDPAGRPLPPPNEPRTIIQQGTFASPVASAAPPAAVPPAPSAP